MINIDREITLDEQVILQYTYARFSDLTSRIDVNHVSLQKRMSNDVFG